MPSLRARNARNARNALATRVMLRACAHDMTHGRGARVYHGLQRMARAGNGMLWRGYNTLLASDLTGLQRVFGAGLYAGLARAFCGPWRAF